MRLEMNFNGKNSFKENNLDPEMLNIMLWLIVF